MDYLSTGLSVVTSVFWSSSTPQVINEQPALLDVPRHVLCCDGGGMKGVLSLEILKAVQDRLTSPLFEHTDLLVGTSTGSIIAGGLSMGKSLEEISSLYDTKGGDIFYTSKYQLIRTLDGSIGPKYNADKLESLLGDYLGTMKISDTLHPTLIYATNETQEVVKIFDGYAAKKNPSSSENVLMSYAIRSSTAAPSYFSAVKDGDDSLCDGGLVANNPSYACLASIKGHFGWQALGNVKMVSVGTGCYPLGVSYEEGKDMGMAQFLRHSDLLFRGPMETNARLTKTMLGEENFCRLNSFLPQNISLDDYSQESLALLRDTALKYIKDNPQDIDKAAKLLQN